MVQKADVSKRILKSLNMCKVKKTEEYFEIELPVVTLFNQQLVTLRVYPLDDGYYISTDGLTFDEYPEYSENYCEQYYDLFMENDSHCHYDIQRYGAYLYKKYEANHSARTAVDEFVKFFVYLDDYILSYWNKDKEV